MTSAGKLGALESIASKIESIHSSNSSSATLSNARSALEDLEKKVEGEKPDPEGHPASSDTQPLHGPKVAPEDHKSPETKKPGSISTAVKGSSSPKSEAKDADGDKSEDNDGKDRSNKKDDTNDKGDKKPEGTDDKSDNSDNPKGKDTKGDGDNTEDKVNTKDSDNLDKKGNNTDGGDDAPKSLGVDDFLTSPPEKASSFEERKRKWEARAKAYTTKTGLSKFDQKHEASELGEDEWQEVLENCGAMYGWYVDGPNKQIVRAPKAAFRLKAIEPPQKPLNSSTGSNGGMGTSSLGVAKSITPSPRAVLTPASSLPTSPSTASSKSSTTDSSRSASIEDLGSSIPISVNGKGAQVSIVPTSSSSHSGCTKPTAQSTGTPSGPPTSPDSHASQAATGNSSDEEKQPAVVLPTFSINDNSRIDVVVSSHEFQTSMAMNDFSASSTSASLSGSYGPISASVSYSQSSSQSSASSGTSDTYHKTMIANYLFPRVDLFLDGSCLEPTPDLKKALVKVEKSKNIKDLRQLRRDFGYLFCKHITLGGRLQTHQLMDQKNTTSEQEQKHAMKTSVGLAVSSPKVGASVSHTQESGSATSSSQATSDRSEEHAFEANGGDTLLASNPVAWVPTVGNYTNWRVINRESLMLMSDAISELEGFEHTRSWFEQAVPVLSRFISFANHPTRQIRLRLMSPNHHLCLSYKKESQDPDYALPPNYYLGHRPSSTVMPIAMNKVDPNDVWGLIEMPGPEPEFLFSPGSYRAPAIYGHAANKVGQSLYGTTYDTELMSTIWSISSPFDDVLCHESRVTIRTNPLRTKPLENAQYTAKAVLADAASALATGQKEASMVYSQPVISSLVVFRNQQGVFLPGMSDSKEIHIWRILKKGALPGTKPPIYEGDEIILAWCFQDQVCGYRDFTEDVFGRRRTVAPNESKNSVLYMKLPWPRFEPVQSLPDQEEPLPNALMMSEVPQPGDSKLTPGDQIRVISKQQSKTTQILVEECIFRLDLVKEYGRGDVDDYLLQGVSQEATFAGTITREAKEKREHEQKEQKDRDYDMARRHQEELEASSHEANFTEGFSHVVSGFFGI
ncbi:hypothetical protein FLONG3_6598 [Fusarium longipes]|uniref:MACPF-like domain-containing protein n=1 Tax=Fusarium longipes TaxID=694270 RepID=A0A395SJI2_9HYPO|nr:hypothetical protein FLONG3_6598 [Fusarium longipes]